MNVLLFEDDEIKQAKATQKTSNVKEEKNMKTITANLEELVTDHKNNETINKEEGNIMENETTNNAVETQVDFETMEISSVTDDNVKEFLNYHVNKVKEDSQSLTGTHLRARTAFTKSLINIGHRVNKIQKAYENHRNALDENTWREYFNNNFPAKFYRSAEDYKRLANVAEIDSYCILGKDRLLNVVKTFKDDLEGDEPKSMSELFIENGVSCDDMQDDNKVIQFTNDVDIMVIMKKFDGQNVNRNKVKTVIENHRRYNKLVTKMQMVVRNNSSLNDYLDAVINNDWATARTLEGRNAAGNDPDTENATSTDAVEPETASTPEQVVEEVKTYISEKKSLLQSTTNQGNNQYTSIINLMEQLEAEINRLNRNAA